MAVNKYVRGPKSRVGWLLAMEVGQADRAKAGRLGVISDPEERPPLPPCKPGTHRASNGVTLADQA